MSSEPAVIATYAFEQLDAPPTVGAIADALALAHREADALREQARAEGYGAGLAAGQVEVAAARAALVQASAELARVRETVIAELEQDALGLAFELAEHVLAGALGARPELVLGVARQALRHLSDRRNVTLVVNPDDLALMSDAAPDLQAALGGIEHLSVQADRRVGRGGAIARTEAGEIDAGIAVQLGRAREIVAEALSAEPADGS